MKHCSPDHLGSPLCSDRLCWQPRSDIFVLCPPLTIPLLHFKPSAEGCSTGTVRGGHITKMSDGGFKHKLSEHNGLPKWSGEQCSTNGHCPWQNEKCVVLRYNFLVWFHLPSPREHRFHQHCGIFFCSMISSSPVKVPLGCTWCLTGIHNFHGVFREKKLRVNYTCLECEWNLKKKHRQDSQRCLMWNEKKR